MIANHTNWTKPFYVKNGLDVEYKMEDYDVITTILSALKWRKFNGSIRMITDNIGLEYYKKLGITSIWDLGVDTSLEQFNQESYIDHSAFWSIGKVLALKTQQLPYVMMDTDFLVWETIEDIWWENELVAIHTEPLAGFYFDKNKMQKHMKPEYNFDSEWDWVLLPFNTGFTFFNDKEFVDYYLNEVIRFIQNINPPKEWTPTEIRVIYSIFTDQRLFSMCAKKIGIEIKPFMELKNARRQKRFSHIWMYKDTLKSNPVARKDFCVKFLNRIITEFAEYEAMIYNIEMFHKYLKLKFSSTSLQGKL
jgi:hypothetical protein